MIRSIHFVLLIIFFSSCQIIKVVKHMHAETPQLYELTNGKRSIIFLPMLHVAKPEFYQNVSETIRSYKQQGFVVYYEGVVYDKNIDPFAKDIYDRKLRKMMGLYLDTSGYSAYLHEKGLFKSFVDQPPYSVLGIDSTDLLVDVRKDKLIDYYEFEYGPIQLTKIDWDLPLVRDSNYPANEKLPEDNVRRVIIGLRDRYLADYISKSNHDKIVVMFGLMHYTGTLNELRKHDRNWKEK